MHVSNVRLYNNSFRKKTSFFSFVARVMICFSEYPYLAYLLETNNRPSQNYDHERIVVQIFWPYLARRIDPAEFVGHLYSAKCITMADMQAINSKHNNVGQQAGAVELLMRIQCRQEPGVWYEKLLELMMKEGLDDLVKEMEPDFYANRVQAGTKCIYKIALL